jgi:hypothetical protein
MWHLEESNVEAVSSPKPITEDTHVQSFMHICTHLQHHGS